MTIRTPRTVATLALTLAAGVGCEAEHVSGGSGVPPLTETDLLLLPAIAPLGSTEEEVARAFASRGYGGEGWTFATILLGERVEVRLDFRGGLLAMIAYDSTPIGQRPAHYLRGLVIRYQQMIGAASAGTGIEDVDWWWCTPDFGLTTYLDDAGEHADRPLVEWRFEHECATGAASPDAVPACAYTTRTGTSRWLPEDVGTRSRE